MLSLKEFKRFKIDKDLDVLELIKGGITCEGLKQVMAYLCEHNPAQADAIFHTFFSEPYGEGYTLYIEDGPCP
jgi:hypothetical protein